MESARQNILTPEGQTGLTLNPASDGGIFINYNNIYDAGIKMRDIANSIYLNIYPSGATIPGSNILARGGDLTIGTQSTNDIVFLADGVEQFRVKAAGGISFTGGLDLTSNIITTGFVKCDKVQDKNGVQLLTIQQNAVADVTGGATIDTQARSALNSLLLRLRNHGIIAT